ncbi:amine oxidase [copper-containing] 3 [Struthio camelus]|uniref:amine oxidase [copper-containing] 3 n=1 Tax=Struthio camelus TaxID=8801 RepID=UPI003603C1DF
MNPRLPYILLVGAAVIIFILSCMLLSRGKRSASCESHPRNVEKTGSRSQSLVFADLTPEEMVQVVRYLQENLGVPLVDASRAFPSDNCIFSVDVQVPAKAEVLQFLDGGGARPAREALAVLYFGNQPDPNITEYVVGPLPTPAYHRDVTVQKYGGRVPYHRRLMLGSEYEQNVSGFFLHPVGLEVLVDHSSLDISQWVVSRVFYNGQYYRDMVQLESAYVQGRISVEKVKKAPRDGDFSSMKPRAPPAAMFPLQYEPQGPRYSVRNNHVVFQAWSFAFGMSVNTGMRLFDVRYQGERVVYEISVQEALSVYGSNCPGGMSTRYMDGSFGIGRFTSPLVRGVDCPYSATYMDVYYLAQSQVSRTTKNALCVFEHNLGSPLRRHYSNLQSFYYGGLVNSALIVRSIATLGNYDYVWDFIFYQNGAIEAKVQATGYVSSSFLHGDGLRYGNRVWEHTLGTIHTHSINYKVDLDVGGVKNSLMAHDMAFEMARAPWSPEQQIERPRLTKKVLDTEDQAAFRHQSKMPRYIYFAANSKNKWGHQRGYRIQIVSFAGEHVPEASSMERAISWARYKLAVTRRKEDEPTSTSIYNQNDPWMPTVAFADFINNETITNEDLVAWITTGFLHIPHSEDIPNTVTVGNSIGFLLRPYNYYDQDPSIYSHDGVFFTGHSTRVLQLGSPPDRAAGALSAVADMSVKTALILLVLALATIFALVCVLLTRGRAPSTCQPQHPEQEDTDDGQSLVFADLTPEEMVQVVRYLQENLGVPLVDASRAFPSDNCIFSVDVQVPAKAEVLQFLDGGGARPAREALAVLYFGNQPDPNITEYVVGPLPTPAYHRDVTVQKYGGKVPYHRRPVTAKEYADIDLLIQRELRQAPRFLAACCDSDGTDLAMLTTAPRGFQSGDRATWFVIFRAVAGTGFFLSPVGLEVLVDHGHLDISRWHLLQVFYNGQYFTSTRTLEAKFAAGLLTVVRVEKPSAETVLGSMRPRQPPGPPGPLPYEPQGPRYSVRHNRVTFQGWSIAFGMNPNSGPRLFDVRYHGERLIYELSLQEALALYGSNCPGGMSTRYLDGSFGIGRFAYELVRGVDCPYLATYVDRHYLVESETPRTNQNSLCIFEHDAALPLRRHFSDIHSAYYGGLRKTTLVIRAVSTLLNYDYVWDFLFYASGAVEVRVHATGYISSSFLHGQGTDYGNRVGPHTLGTLHLHHMHYKVDLDVGGRLNWLESQDMGYESVRDPWSMANTIERPFLRKERLERENDAAFPLGGPMPRYLTFTSSQRNQWGHPRSYRLQIVSFAGEHLPASSRMERAISWGRYQLAVTQRKEEEPASSSVYNQNDPWTPTVAFADFIDNETIAGQDLVAWISVGFLHVPHAEDVPNTVTVGNGVGFLLRPYNYFDEDPSAASPDSTYLGGERDAAGCGTDPLSCLPEAAACAPHLPPFRYGGFLNLSLPSRP